MDEAILRNYWLFTASLSIISVAITICIFKWKQIKQLFKFRISLLLTKDKVRDEVYDVFKEMNPSYRKYIRQTVREYLKELQDDKPRKRTYKKQVLQDDKTNA
jgi:flagellar biosynthesis protein FlhB